MVKKKLAILAAEDIEKKKKDEAEKNTKNVTAKDVADKFGVQLTTNDTGRKTTPGVNPVNNVVNATKQKVQALYQQKVADLVSRATAYAKQGPDYTLDLANSIINGAITSPGKGNTGKLDIDAIHDMTKANSEISRALSESGIFNIREIATNPVYAHLATQDYRTSLLPVLQDELTASLEADKDNDAAVAEYESALRTLRADYTKQAETAAQWKDFFSLVGEEATLEDKLRAAGIATGKTYDRSVFAGMDKYSAYAKKKELDDWYASLDAAALSAAPVVEEPEAPKYDSKTAGIQDEISTLEKYLNAHQTLEELTAYARSNPDFATASVYTAPDYSNLSAWEQFLMPQIGGAYADNALYTYINTGDVDPHFSQSTESADYYKRWEELGYDYMLDQDKEIWNVLRTMDPAKADAYLQALSQIYLLPTRAQGYRSWDETVATNGLTAVPAWIGSVGRGIDNILSVPQQLAEAWAGVDNPYSEAFDSLNRQGYTRGAQLGAIQEAEMPEWMKTVAGYAYQGVSGAADNTARLLATGMNPTAALIAAGLQSASGSLHESSERDDVSGAAKIVKAIGAGAIEVGTEKIGLDALFDKGKSGALQYLKGVVLSEMGEETLNALSEPALEAVVAYLFDHEAEIKSGPEFFKDLTDTAITTAISSLLMGGGGAINQTITNRQTGKTVTEQGDPERMVEIAKSMDPNSEVYQIAAEIETSTKKGQKMPLGKLGRLTQEMGNVLGEQYADLTNGVMNDAITERLIELGSDPEAARRNADAIRKIGYGLKVTVQERAGLIWDKYADQVAREVAQGMHTVTKGVASISKGIEDAKQGVRNAVGGFFGKKENSKAVDGDAAGGQQISGQDGDSTLDSQWVTNARDQQLIESEGVLKQQGDLARALTTRKNVSTTVKEAVKNSTGKVRKGANGEAAGNLNSARIAYDDGTGSGEGDIQRFEESEDGKLLMVIEGKDGEAKVDIGSFTQADGEGTAGLLESIKDINDNLHKVSAEEASAMLSSYKAAGGDVARFVESYETLYLRGYSGVADDTNLPATDLDGTLANIAVEAGKRQAEKDEQQRLQRAGDYKALETTVAGWLGKVSDNSQVHGMGDTEALAGAMERMTETQRRTAEVCLNLGKALGLNVVLFESDVKNLRGIQNGSFDEATHTVYLDINSGVGSMADLEAQRNSGTLGAAMLRVMSHELTHYLEVASPEMYAKYKAAVRTGLKAAGKETDMAVLIREKIDRALNAGRKMSYKAAEAEVIADASEYMLKDSKFTNDLDPTLKGKIKSFIQNFAQKVKEIFNHLTGSHKESAALREMKNGVLRYMDGLQELWDAGFDEIMGKGTMEQTADAAEAVESIPVEELEATRKFSMDRDVEVRDDDLIAVHNLKEYDVMGTLELGGFPMPSIAIVRAKDGHTMYGDYSVVFGKETIDPKADTKNRVYGADAWTPVFPVVETEILDDEMYEVQQEAESLAKQVDDEYGRKARTWFGNFDGMDSTTKTMEDIQDSAWNNSGMVAAYLADQGETVEILEKDVPVERGYNPARADMYDQLLDIVDVLDLVEMKAHELIDTYGDRLAEAIPRPFARMNANWKAGDRQAGVRMVEIFRQAVAYEGSGRDTSEKVQKAKDYYATDDAMRARVDRSDFNAWVKEKMQRTFGAKGIYNGKDSFTPSGNRRTFKQIHDDVTAKNVVKSMASQQESNIPATDAKGLMAAAASMYKSIAEIKGDVSRLGKISDEEYSARIAAANNAHHELLNALEAWDYDQIEAVGEVLVQAAKKRMSATEIAALLKKNGYKATKKTGELAANLIHQVQTIPSGYFEAKPARVVEFDEIKMIVAPDTMPVSLAKALDERGIPYTTYDGSEADRLKKMNDLPGVRFSMRDGPVTDDEVLRALKWCAQLTARNDRSYDWNYVPVRATTPHYILADLEEKDVPMVMNVNKTRQALTKEGKAFGESVGHGYTPKEMADLFKKIDQPEYFAYSMQRGNYGVVVEHKGNGVVFIIAPPANMNADQLLSEHGGRRTVAVTIFQRESVEDAIFYLENGGYKERPVPAEAKGNHVPERTKESVNHSVLQVDEKVNPGLRYSDRDLPTDITVRDYLAEMEPTDRMNETEKILLKRYKETLGKLQEAERNAAEQDEIIKTAHFRNPDGSLNDELTKAKNRYQIYRKQADRYARELARAERAEGFAGMLATGQQLVDKYLTGGYTRIADASDELDEEIKGIEKKLKTIGATLQGAEQAQKNAHARGLFNQTELNAAAKQLKDSYASRMSVKEIANRLALAYGEIYADNGAEGAKRFADAAKELAQDIVYSSKYRYRSETLSLIAEEVPVISLTETDKQEIKNAGLTISQYKRGIAPFVKVAEGASDLSSYVSNAEAYGGQIANILGTDTEGNLAMALYNVIQAERSSEQAGTFEGMTEGESISSVMVDIMSANLPMTTDSTTLDYLRKEMLKQAGTSQAAAKAVEGAIQSAKTATRKASSLWHRAVQEVKLSEDVIDYYRALDEQRRLMELAEQKKALSEQLKTDAAKKIHEQVEKQRTEYREREQRAREYRKTREGVEKLRRGIGRKVKRLNTLRVRETDQKHVPQELQHVADMVMQTFTDSSLGRLAFPEAKMNSLARTYRELRLLESDATYYWDDEIEADITNLQALGEAYSALKNREGSVPSMYSLEGVELETEILQGVDAIVSNVMQMIDSTNDAFLTQRSETFSEFANKTGEKLRQHDDYKVKKGWLGKMQTMLDEGIRTGNMTPIYFFDHLKNPELLAVFDEIREGMHKAAMIEREGKEYIERVRTNRNYGKWVADGRLKMKTGNGHTIELTREEACEIYAIAKREKANKLYQTEHLLYGGFQFKHIDQHVSEDGKHLVQDMPHQLDAADLEKISNWLTDEQKGYADDLVAFLSTRMAEYGNDASMAMYGYEKFTESYYIPFRTVAEQRYLRGDEGPQGENAGTGRLLNSGFTKKLQHKANATLYVGGISETVGEHIHKMAAYSAMVQPIENLKRLLNHKVLDNDGTANTLRALIGQKYGRAAENYMTQLLKDLNGATQSDQRAADLPDKLVGAFKRGAVMASASVVLQQPTAMARAMAMISPKYFAQNPFYRPSKGTWEKMMKYSGTAIIKDMGKYDVGMGKTASQYILDEDLSVAETYQRLVGESKTKAGKAALDRFIDWLTSAPGKADQWTWGLIWKAAEAETAALNPRMDRNSDEFLRLVGKRFDDVVDHTQVYDSVLTKSNLMRSQNGFHKMATSFMAEPTLSINMLYDALTGKHGKKQAARIIGSVAASQVLAGALAALVQAWNDDEDERNWMEKYADRASSNIFSNINVFGMIPYVSDIVSLFEGYDVERPDLSVIADVMDYTKKYFKGFEDGGIPSWKDTENFVGTLANLVGIPAKNISREIRRTRNAIFNTDWSAPSAFNLGQVISENTIFNSGKNTEYYQRIVTAELRGDTKLADNLRSYMLTSKMVTEDKMKSGIKTALKEAYIAGDTDDDTAIDMLLKIGAYDDREDAYWEVDKWQYMQETGESADNYGKYSDFFTAVESGTDLKATIQIYLDNGVSKTTLASKITSQYKPQLIALKQSGKGYADLQARILTAYEALGYDRDKKLKDIQKWFDTEGKK